MLSTLCLYHSSATTCARTSSYYCYGAARLAISVLVEGDVVYDGGLAVLPAQAAVRAGEGWRVGEGGVNVFPPHPSFVGWVATMWIGEPHLQC